MKEKQERFGFRKLTIGLASVCIGATLFGTNLNTVKADTIDSSSQAAKTNEAKTTDNVDPNDVTTISSSANQVQSDKQNEITTLDGSNKTDVSINNANKVMPDASSKTDDASKPSEANATNTLTSDSNGTHGVTTSTNTVPVNPAFKEHDNKLTATVNTNSLAKPAAATPSSNITNKALTASKVATKDPISGSNEDGNAVATSNPRLLANLNKILIAKQPALFSTKIANANLALIDNTLPVLNTNDAYALDEKNGLHEHANVNDNGGYDKDFWGTIDLNNWNYAQDDTGNITLKGYKGSDNTKIIVPNIADFAHGNAIKTITLQVNPNVDTDKVYISSDVMHDLAHNATRIGLSKTKNKKVVASDAIWQDAFGGATNGPSGDNSDGGIKVLNPNLTIMDLHNLDTSNITDMSAMFNGGTNLETIGDLSDWDTSKITNMHAMFQLASSLTNIGDLSKWDTGKVTDMSYMFNRASNLTNTGDLSKWDTSKVTDMSAMFQLASSLTNIGNLNNWKTGNVTNMNRMFSEASNLTNIGNLSNWDTSKVTDMTAMFQLASSLTNIGNLNNWNTSNVTDMSWMFNQASSLINIGDLSNWDTSKVTNMQAMFQVASSLTNIGNLSKWNTGKVTDMNAMFQLASSLTNIGNLDNWKTANVTDMSSMFNQASSLTNIGDLSKWNTSKVTDMHAMFQLAPSLTNIGNLNNWNTSNVTDMNRMFNGASNLTNIGDLSKWDTSKVTDMTTMFQSASSLTNIGNLDNWNTGNVTDISFMFNQASNLTNIGNLSKWNTGKVTDMSAMFQVASSLTNIGDLSNWNTSNVTDMNRMFNEASNLTNIGNLSKWDTSKVTDMHFMFNHASKLANIGDLSGWDTSNVTNMKDMFGETFSLTNIGDLSKWDTSNVTDMSFMFISAKSLHNLNISNWNLAKLTDKEALKYIFANDVNLTVIANNITLPTWYDNELNDSDYFWNNHMAVITNNDKLLKATGDTDTLTIDNTQATRSIFYDSKGSSDAIKVLTDANNQYIADYNKANPSKLLKLSNTVDQNDPISLANASFITVPNTVKTIITYHDSTDNRDLIHTQELSGINQITIEPSNLILPENYELDSNLPAMQYGTNYLINVKHKTAVVIQQDLATRTINVHLPNGTTKVYQQVIGYQRDVITDLVTKEVTHGTWTVNDVTSSFTIDGVKQLEHSYVLKDGTYNYANVKLPKIPGYKAKISLIPSGNSVQPAMFLVSFVALLNVNPGAQNAPDDTKQDQDAVINTKHLNTANMQIVSNQPVLLENANNSLQMLNTDNNLQALNADTSTWQVENSVVDELITPYVVFNLSYKLYLPRFDNYNLQIIKHTSNKDSLSFVYLNQNKTFKYVFNIKIEDSKYLLSISEIENKRFIPVKEMSFNDYHQLIELIVKLINK